MPKMGVVSDVDCGQLLVNCSQIAFERQALSTLVFRRNFVLETYKNLGQNGGT